MKLGGGFNRIAEQQREAANAMLTRLTAYQQKASRQTKLAH